jgi:hypothetical protein
MESNFSQLEILLLSNCLNITQEKLDFIENTIMVNTIIKNNNLKMICMSFFQTFNLKSPNEENIKEIEKEIGIINNFSEENTDFIIQLLITLKSNFTK